MSTKQNNNRVTVGDSVPHVCHRPSEHKGKNVYVYPEGSSQPGFAYCRDCWKDHRRYNGRRKDIKKDLEIATRARAAVLADLRSALTHLQELPFRNGTKIATQHIETAFREIEQQHQKESDQHLRDKLVARVSKRLSQITVGDLQSIEGIIDCLKEKT